MNPFIPSITINQDGTVVFNPSIPLIFEEENTTYTFDNDDPEEKEFKYD